MKKLLIILCSALFVSGCKKKDPVPQYTVTYHAYCKKSAYTITYVTGSGGPLKETVGAGSFDKTIVLNEKIDLYIAVKNLTRMHGDSVYVSAAYNSVIDYCKTYLDSTWSNCSADINMKTN